ncbi:hypothetical protein [Brevibacillus laterosporus]|uniref:hypothetical protein n=1 Tax=Brevibacillus laterosporus TaxID=1465 RepID=UPI000839C7F1|nr:hypothetical protein [Brevibacillus laterosporus]
MVTKITEDEYTRVLLQLVEEFERKLFEFTNSTDGKDFLQAILKGHLYIEQELNLLLNKHLKYPEHLDKRMNFISKLNLVFALGVIESQEKEVIVRINELRNKYAHKVDFEINQEYFDKKIVDAFSPQIKQRYNGLLLNYQEDKDQLIIQLGIALYTVWYMLVEETLIPDDIKKRLQKDSID